MTVKDAVERFGFTVAAAGDMEREISSVYVGDLLSWVMGNLREDNAWITIQGHLNIVAVANLAGAACIIVAEGAEAAPETIAKAEVMDIPILKSGLSIYQVAKLFSAEY